MNPNWINRNYGYTTPTTPPTTTTTIIKSPDKGQGTPMDSLFWTYWKILLHSVQNIHLQGFQPYSPSQRFARPPALQPQLPNQSFYRHTTPALQPLATTHAPTQFRPVFTQGAAPLPLVFQQRKPTNGSISPRFNRSSTPNKGVKRKAENGNHGNGCLGDATNITTLQENGLSNSDEITNASVPAGMLQPLYCKICCVTLNAPSQARQHYEGKNHAKKLKSYVEGEKKKEGEKEETTNNECDSSNTSSPSTGTENNKNAEQPSSTTNGQSSTTPQTTAEINPEIYCKICGVSFNSPKQAQQHYQGKNHAKRLRASHAASNPVTSESSTSTKQGSKFICFVCNIHVTSQEQLDGHLKGAKHLSKVKMAERSSGALKGRWGQSKPSSPGGGGGGKGLPAGVRATPTTPNGVSSQLGSSGFQPPPYKKAKHRDFSNFRTPSGRYYCSSCNVTLTTEAQFVQHVDSKKHKANNSARRNSESMDV